MCLIILNSRCITDSLKAFGCSEVSQAVLVKSRSRLAAAIAHCPSSIDEPNLIGQTPLHLSADWIEGVCLLLDAGANIDAPDRTGFTPVFYAARLGLLDTLQVLAERHCSFLPQLTKLSRDLYTSSNTLSLLEYTMTLESRSEEMSVRIREEYFQYKAPRNATAVVNAVLKVVVHRRKTHKAMNQDYTAPETLRRHGLPPCYVFKVGPSFVKTSFAEERSIPRYLANVGLPGGSIYHIYSLNLRHASKFWESGFYHVDQYNEVGLTPIMSGDSFQYYDDLGRQGALLEWFVSHGADLQKKQASKWQKIDSHRLKCRRLISSSPVREPSSTAALHYVATHLGQTLYWQITQYKKTARWLLDDIYSVSVKSRHMMRIVFISPTCDSCKCSCSSRGCTAYTMIVKSSIMQALMHDIKTRRCCRAVALTITKVLTPFLEADRRALQWLRREMLRCITFNALDLRHTCCNISRVERRLEYVIAEAGDEEDWREIRDEQAEKAMLLETLLDEFQDKYDELAIPFERFVGGYWRDRMREIRAKQKPIDRAALESVGVRLDQTDDSFSESSNEGVSDDDPMD